MLPRITSMRTQTFHSTLLTLVLMVVSLTGTGASAQSWSLTKAQRQQYLQYYAPIILKRANANNGDLGRDWLTNFDFDRDGNFSTNRQSWFFGTYSVERDADAAGSSDDFKTPAYTYGAMDSRGRTRGSASGYLNSHNAFWWQHDYFVHTGDVDSNASSEAGFWLAGAWYLAANGGFDGRWVQLFDDRVND
jgi:hypothetical protein